MYNPDGTHPYSSWPAVSRTSRRATSSSMTHCLRYESAGWIRYIPHKMTGLKRYKRRAHSIRGTWWDPLGTGCEALIWYHEMWRLTLDCGVVLLNEMTLDELNSQTRFSDTYRKELISRSLAEAIEAHHHHRQQQVYTLSKTVPDPRIHVNTVQIPTTWIQCNAPGTLRRWLEELVIITGEGRGGKDDLGERTFSRLGDPRYLLVQTRTAIDGHKQNQIEPAPNFGESNCLKSPSYDTRYSSRCNVRH